MNIYDEIAELKSKVQVLEKMLAQLTQDLNKQRVKSYLSVKEAAKLLGRSAYTVSEYCRTGRIKATRSSKKGKYIITQKAILEFTT